MREDPKLETQAIEDKMGRSKTAPAHKQMESKVAEIMQQGDKRPMGETVVARDFY